MNDLTAVSLDHRDLNRDLDIFATDALVGSGLPLVASGRCCHP